VIACQASDGDNTSTATADNGSSVAVVRSAPTQSLVSPQGKNRPFPRKEQQGQVGSFIPEKNSRSEDTSWPNERLLVEEANKEVDWSIL
jgi:hypothetical protein